ncbi:hypothetical protein K501DRAFT_244552 [Backusella circina FSU 941]|nr:hypothetical protein K501DRAFT_244552 [Backusella circina FSU 941]
MSVPDPIALASPSISAYMSGHENANLAYVRYFADKKEAVSATFTSLNSNGFIITYKTSDGSEHEALIKYTSPVVKRDDVRKVLEEMAKEAEEALGMPSSLNGPPPFKALAKAAEIEEAQKAELEKTREDEEAKRSAEIAQKAAGGDIFAREDEPNLDVFYPADKAWQVAVVLGLANVYLFAYGSDEAFSALPSFVLDFRNRITAEHCQKIFFFACAAHITEGLYALGVCLKRGCYSPINTFKWTLSTLLFGFNSTRKLNAHGRVIKKASKKAQ